MGPKYKYEEVVADYVDIKVVFASVKDSKKAIQLSFSTDNIEDAIKELEHYKRIMETGALKMSFRNDYLQNYHLEGLRVIE